MTPTSNEFQGATAQLHPRRYESKGEVMEELYNFNGETRGEKTV